MFGQLKPGPRPIAFSAWLSMVINLRTLSSLFTQQKCYKLALSHVEEGNRARLDCGSTFDTKSISHFFVNSFLRVIERSCTIL